MTLREELIAQLNAAKKPKVDPFAQSKIDQAEAVKDAAVKPVPTPPKKASIFTPQGIPAVDAALRVAGAKE